MYLWSRLYSFKHSQWFIGKRNWLYTLWLRNFLGEVGENAHFNYPIRLQGGGNRRIHIGARTHVGAFCVLGSWESYGKDESYNPEIIIGSDCSIGEFCHLSAINKIIIGDGLLTGRFVYIGDNAHGGLSYDEANIPPGKRKLISKGKIVIGKNVWIGDKATILGGVSIGNNVIVAANTVVTKDCPNNSIIAGIPGKVVKQIKSV